ncbi:MAG: hypothetical protein ACI4QR_06525 [Eubacteriales bacterium]
MSGKKIFRRDNIDAMGEKPKKVSALNIVIYIFVRLIFIVAAVIAATNADYLTAFQCVLAFVVFLLPSMMDKKFNIELPNALELAIIIFTFMAVLGGELGNFYAQYPLWDKILHTSSGFMIAAIGLALINFMNKRKSAIGNLSPFFICAFAFCFALSIEVIWEFFEFAVDKFSMTTDMQADYFVTSFASKKAGGDKNPVPLVVDNIKNVVINFSNGREPLVLPAYIDIGGKDTMYDLMVGALGAFIFCTVEFIALTARKARSKKRAQKIADSFVIKKRLSDTEKAVADVELMAMAEMHSKVGAISSPDDKDERDKDASSEGEDKSASDKE